MSLGLVAVVVLVAFLVLLVLGRGQLARGANPEVANGAVTLVLAAVVGLLAVVVLASSDVW